MGDCDQQTARRRPGTRAGHPARDNPAHDLDDSGVDIACFTCEREGLGPAASVPSTAVCWPSLSGRKNHRLLLDTMRLLKQMNVPVVALLAGEGWGTYPQELQDYAATLGVGGSVRFLDHQPATSVYRASDVFVLPSRQEGFPLSVIEAMLCGLVPIRTPSEGAEEQITDGQTGYIVLFDRPEVLAVRLETLANDPALRQQLADAAQRTARERFSASRTADETLQVYREALGGR
jgi:glycosyltransferase involved in cell wall biosynthesis